MALRRFPVVLSLVLTMAFGAARATGATETAPAPARGFGTRSVAAAIRSLSHAAVPSARASTAAFNPDSICWERDYNDPVGDAPIDAVAYRLVYDCQTASWRFSVTLAAPPNPATFDSVASEIDTDNNPNDGCDGFDLLVAGVIDGGPKGVVVATPSCDARTWTQVASATFAMSGVTLSLTYAEAAFANAPRLIWNAGVVPKATTDPVDALPDAGVLVADKFLQQTTANDGYRLVDAAGGVHVYGNARFRGDLAGAHLARPIVGTAPTPNGKSYWLVASDGGIFSFGDAAFHGSTGAMHLNRPIVGIASTPTGHGYWLVASDGGIFSFGDARFHGSTGAIHLNQPVVGIAATPTGNGYWLVAADGGIFSFGDATFYGSTGGIRLSNPIVGMTTSASGRGYRFVAADGGIFSFGDAQFLGGLGGGRPPSPVVGMD